MLNKFFEARYSEANVRLLRRGFLWCVIAANIVTHAYQSNTAISFDGQDDYVEILCSDVLNTPEFTVEFWAKLTSSSSEGVYQAPIMSRSEDCKGFNFYVNPENSWEFWIGNGAWNIISDPEAAVLNEWVHIAGTYDGSIMRFYKNAILVSERVVDNYIPNSTINTKIGFGFHGFSGIIDEVRIWNNARSSIVLNANRNETLFNHEGSPCLVGYWRFDEGTGTTVIDNSWNDNDGALMNGASWSTMAAPIEAGIPNFVQKVSFPNGNYIDNCDFEEGYAGWDQLGTATLELASPGQGISCYTGTHALKITTAADYGSDRDGITFSFSDELVSATKHQKDCYYNILNKNAVFSAWIYAIDAVNVVIGLDAPNAATYNPIAADGKWHKITSGLIKGVQKSANATEDRITCIIGQSEQDDHISARFLIDAVCLEVVDDDEASQPMVSTDYFDGYGAVFQTQIRSEDNDVINGKIFNAFGDARHVSKTFMVNNDRHDFVTDMWGKLDAYYSPGNTLVEGVADANGYPYSSFEYENQPSRRISKSIPAGSEYRDYFTTYAYTNSEATMPEKYYKKTISEKVSETQEHVTSVFEDHMGNTIRTVSYSNDGSDDIINNYGYDLFGNKTAVQYPRYQSAGDNQNFESQYLFNTLGQLVKEEHPNMDDGSIRNPAYPENDIDNNPDKTHYYDAVGNLIRTTDANQANEQGGARSTIFEYDNLNRLISTSIGMEPQINAPITYNGGEGIGAGSRSIEFTVPHSQDIDLVDNEAYTFSMWYKYDNYSQKRYLCHKASRVDQSSAFNLTIEDKRIKLALNYVQEFPGGPFETYILQSSEIIMLPGQWYNLTLVKQSKNIRIYHNGYLCANGSFNDVNEKVNTNSDNGEWDLGVYFYDGAFDEIALWDVAKNADEVQNSYYVNPIISDDLVLYYNFEDLDIDDKAIIDKSTHGNDGEFGQSISSCNSHEIVDSYIMSVAQEASINGLTVESYYCYDNIPDWSQIPWNNLAVSDKSVIGSLRNLKGQLAAKAYKNTLPGAAADDYGYTFYSYDNHGNITKVAHRLPGVDTGIKVIEYDYSYNNLIRSMTFDNNTVHYRYDHLGRLQFVNDGNNINYCSYEYYPNNQLKSIAYYDDENNEIDRLEYRYNIRDWLKSINGIESSANFSEVITYNDATQNNDLYDNYFNGNISKTEYKLKSIIGTDPLHYKYRYQYDIHNRLNLADFTPSNSVDWDAAAITYDPSASDAYDVHSIQYNQNSAITNICRNDDEAVTNNLRMNYWPGTDKLRHKDNDGDDYYYDHNGNLVVDLNKAIGAYSDGAVTPGVVYNYMNLPLAISVNGSELKFVYDADGNRVIKILE